MRYDYRQPPDRTPWYDELGTYDPQAFAGLRLAPSQQPLPDFSPCPWCELRRSCAAARHCAKEPRRVEQPAVPNTPKEKER